MTLTLPFKLPLKLTLTLKLISPLLFEQDFVNNFNTYRADLRQYSPSKMYLCSLNKKNIRI